MNKNQITTLVSYSSMIAVLSLGWMAGESGTEYLKTLPVFSLAQSSTASEGSPINLQSFYPVSIHSAHSAVELPTPSVKPIVTTVTAKQQITQKEIVQDIIATLSVQGITQNGAFINNHYYPIGGEVPTLASRDTDFVHFKLILVGISHKEVTFQWGTHPFAISLD